MTNPESGEPVLHDIDQRGVAQVVLNRPERNNAYDGALIQALLAALDTLEQTRGLRAVVISGRGRHFQAGADLTWIDAVRAASRDDNIAASRATAQAIWRRYSTLSPAKTTRSRRPLISTPRSRS